MGWGFVWLMVVLKIPIGLLLWLVWWAVHQTPDDAGELHGGDGGSAAPHPPSPRLPRPPRSRGPHGEPSPAAPPRCRRRIAPAQIREH